MFREVLIRSNRQGLPLQWQASVTACSESLDSRWLFIAPLPARPVLGALPSAQHCTAAEFCNGLETSTYSSFSWSSAPGLLRRCLRLPRGRKLELDFGVNQLEVALREHTTFRAIVLNSRPAAQGAVSLGGCCPTAVLSSCATHC